MKAVRYHGYGDTEVLRYEDVATPQPTTDQVLIQVAGTSFNPVDNSIRAGYLREVFPVRFPHTPGIDVAGVVSQLGDGVEGFRVGDAVVAFLPMNENGAAAEFVLAPADVLTAAPTSIPLPDAAALPTVGLTAYQALFELADLREGQRILINGAGGGVGGFAVQLAKRVGAHVIATASARSADTVRTDGADEVIDYTSTSVSGAINAPLDAVLSLVTASEQDLAALVDLIRPGGVIVTTATAAQEDSDRQVRALPLFVRSDADQLASLVAQVNSGELRVNVTGSYPLAELARVQQRGAAGEFNGKVVITPTA
jgi:NADPH:quinone reductase-like Zn-dependent oxidoreductase